eukprot:357076-Chlamydomonas_euryale.AAC.1
MTGLLTRGSRPPRQKSAYEGDPCHFDPICELAISPVVLLLLMRTPTPLTRPTPSPLRPPRGGSHPCKTSPIGNLSNLPPSPGFPPFVLCVNTLPPLASHPLSCASTPSLPWLPTLCPVPQHPPSPGFSPLVLCVNTVRPVPASQVHRVEEHWRERVVALETERATLSAKIEESVAMCGVLGPGVACVR